MPIYILSRSLGPPIIGGVEFSQVSVAKEVVICLDGGSKPAVTYLLCMTKVKKNRKREWNLRIMCRRKEHHLYLVLVKLRQLYTNF